MNHTGFSGDSGSALIDVDSTIVGIATPPLESALRGVVRLCGPQAPTLAARLDWLPASTPTGCSPRELLERAADARPAAVDAELRIGHPALPVSLALAHWPGRRSFTRQPTVEFHLWSNPPLLAALVDELGRAGARLARPGEFTLRAFLAGRIDLLQAEAILGIIDAADRREFEIALRQSAHAASDPLRQAARALLDALADVEASLDFAEEDLDCPTPDDLRDRLRRVDEQLDRWLRDADNAPPGSRQRVVLVGPPNAGKSTLFNALAGRAAALTAERPGTTRDYLEETIELDHGRICLIDTAGTDSPTPDDDDRTDRFLTPLQADLHRHAAEQRHRADLCLVCFDATRPPPHEWIPRPANPRVLLVATKVDLAPPPNLPELAPVSAWTGQGLAWLRHEISNRLGRSGPTESFTAATLSRCREALRGCRHAIASAGEGLLAGQPPELVAGDLRLALDALAAVTGQLHTDDLLDRVFSRFCIGK